MRLLILLLTLFICCATLTPKAPSSINLEMIKTDGFSPLKTLDGKEILFLKSGNKGGIALIFSSESKAFVELGLEGVEGLSYKFYPPSFNLKAHGRKACLLKFSPDRSLSSLYLSPSLIVEAHGSRTIYPLPPLLVSESKPSFLLRGGGEVLKLKKGEEANILLITKGEAKISSVPLGIEAVLTPSPVRVIPEGKASNLLVKAPEDAVPWLYEIKIKAEEEITLVVEVLE